jgi:hypothetical protein
MGIPRRTMPGSALLQCDYMKECVHCYGLIQGLNATCRLDHFKPTRSTPQD